MSNGLTQLTSAQIQRKISHQKLFGLDELNQYLFRFCQAILTADEEKTKDFSLYDLKPSVLLYGIPNTGKTTLCYLLFNELKNKVTNEINFYSVDVGKMLDPALGQSSRNLEEIFEQLKTICKNGSSVFLLLDELDAFCMSRSRIQEHDAIRRAMTTLMLELDHLDSSQNKNLLIFGITNVPELIDTAVVRRFSLKQLIQPTLTKEVFQKYLEYIGKPMKYQSDSSIIDSLYDLYQKRKFTVGDIKALYKEVYVYYLCEPDNQSSQLNIEKKVIELFENGFSTGEHLSKTKEALAKS